MAWALTGKRPHLLPSGTRQRSGKCSLFDIQPLCAKNRNPHGMGPSRQMFIVRLDIWQAAISLHLIPCPHLIANNPCANNRTGSFPSAHDVDSKRQLMPQLQLTPHLVVV
jgi:hypothetical protein